MLAESLSSSSSSSHTRVISILRPSSSLCVAAGTIKLATSYPHAFFRVCHCEAAPTTLKVQQPVRFKHQQQEKKRNGLWKDIWDLTKSDIGLMCCILLTAVAAALIQLQTPVITGELINVISSGIIKSGTTFRELNGPALKLFGLLSAQGE